MINPAISKNQAPKILLVEDTLIAQTVAEALLMRLGCQVTIAEKGAVALDLYESNHFDLIFMDIGLPDIPGYVVAKNIRDMEKNSKQHIPIIALTAHATLEVEEKCFSMGIDGVLHKPLSDEQAREILTSYALHVAEEVVTKPINKRVFAKLQSDAPLTIIEPNANKEMLDAFMVSWVEFRENIESAKQQKTRQALIDLVHKLHGGACYAGTPRLQEAVKSYEIGLKKGADDLEALYQQLLKEFDILEAEYKKLL
jgi:two-component system, OmpR family, aerobic respiration control sensor histidine kinase ArcB